MGDSDTAVLHADQSYRSHAQLAGCGVAASSFSRPFAYPLTIGGADLHVLMDGPSRRLWAGFGDRVAMGAVEDEVVGTRSTPAVQHIASDPCPYPRDVPLVVIGEDGGFLRLSGIALGSSGTWGGLSVTSEPLVSADFAFESTALVLEYLD